MTDIPVQAVEVEKFTPHAYDQGDQVHLIMSNETLVLNFRGEKHEMSKKLWKKHGRLALCNFATTGKTSPILFARQEFSIGDPIKAIIPHDIIDFGQIEKILFISAN
jgi:hypothetical protein